MKRARIGAATTLTAAALVALAACSSSGGSSNPPATQPPSPTPTGPAQTVTISPHTGLTNGESVKIVGLGYTAGKTYGVTECADKGAATGAGDCDLRGIKTAVATSTGEVGLFFNANKGPFGSNNIVCSATQKCLISVATAGSAAPDEVASANITFG
jgi:hypothetical protein